MKNVAIVGLWTVARLLAKGFKMVFLEKNLPSQ